MREAPLHDQALNTRVRPTQKELAVLAARHEGVTLSEFVREAVISSAARVLTPRQGA